MNEFHLLARRTIKNTTIVTVLLAALWALLPQYASVFAGLTIGSAVSLYFAVSVARQTEQAAEVALFQVKKRPSIVMVFRIVMVMAAILIMRIVEKKIGYVSLPGLIVGLFTYQFVLLGGFLYKKTS
ncbi:hypothetical protein JJB07_02140 [Tumebacillus sp. ITR2]|uniref:ATP synthase subunit I n=1 Tax=Tumebacillus amylolyticus TaxID=2801339 RepID=A0ABS1J5A6_9BACL|nr:hypothetical protein [Tumebacillus amylolyticus]MBL0385436.1 hypothetical protein [Tumebacillus amylolyticus]